MVAHVAGAVVRFAFFARTSMKPDRTIPNIANGAAIGLIAAVPLQIFGFDAGPGSVLSRIHPGRRVGPSTKPAGNIPNIGLSPPPQPSNSFANTRGLGAAWAANPADL